MPAAIAVPALALVLAGAGLAVFQQADWLFPVGLAAAAGAPLSYMFRHRSFERPLRHHPITVSGISGLGCVMVMIGSQRFGDDPAWALPSALAALVIWMLWQRGQRNPSESDRRG